METKLKKGEFFVSYSLEQNSSQTEKGVKLAKIKCRLRYYLSVGVEKLSVTTTSLMGEWNNLVFSSSFLS